MSCATRAISVVAERPRDLGRMVMPRSLAPDACAGVWESASKHSVRSARQARRQGSRMSAWTTPRLRCFRAAAGPGDICMIICVMRPRRTLSKYFDAAQPGLPRSFVIRGRVSACSTGSQNNEAALVTPALRGKKCKVEVSCELVRARGLGEPPTACRVTVEYLIRPPADESI